ncbi:MAG: right-handed parallel beta-helix repeat-containing protein, partial [Meiothermus sp.]|nr:right-handed parallel beta-helix repeat-containing protein [Meiothermus sp.]
MRGYVSFALCVLPMAWGQGSPVAVPKGADLAKAIAEAPAGAVLRLEAGEYRLARGLEIGKPLTLQGEGRDKTRIRSDAANFVLSINVRGRFNALGISFEHFGSRIANVVVVGGGEAVFEKSRFQGGKLELESGQGGDGIWVRGSARATLRSSEFLNNELHGVDVSEEAQVFLQGSVVRGNRDAGVAFYDEARGEVRGNTIERNNAHGIYVAGQARPLIEGNTLRGNRLWGVYVEATANPTLRQNNFSGNRRGTSQFLGQPFTPSPKPGADLTSILARAPEGSTVTLAAGEYVLPRGLEVANSVTLVGQGREQTRLVSSAGGFVLRYTGRGRLSVQNLSIVYRAVSYTHLTLPTSDL